MANPVFDIKRLLAHPVNTYTGTVTEKMGTFLKVTTVDGVVNTAFGNFNINDYVYVKDGNVLGIIKKDAVKTVVVP